MILRRQRRSNVTEFSKGILPPIRKIYSLVDKTCTCVREEEIDWSIYHIIAYENIVSTGDISLKTGFDEETVIKSLKRLEASSLIGYDGENARILSLQEMILKCKIKNAASGTDSPVIIENGVIKENPNYKR